MNRNDICDYLGLGRYVEDDVLFQEIFNQIFQNKTDDLEDDIKSMETEIQELEDEIIERDKEIEDLNKENSRLEQELYNFEENCRCGVRLLSEEEDE